MKRLTKTIRPKKGYATFLHGIINVFYVVILFLLVSFGFVWVALFAALLSKWRIFAVKPRYWLAHIKANLVDISVAASCLAFMAGSGYTLTRAIWALFYIVWLLFIKPLSSQYGTSAQAMIAQALALTSLLTTFPKIPIVFLVAIVWLIGYGCGSHFLNSFEAEESKMLAHIWAIFCAASAWLFGHWSVSYLSVPLLAVFLSICGYSLALLFGLDWTNRLSTTVCRQIILIGTALLAVVLVFSEWQSTRF